MDNLALAVGDTFVATLLRGRAATLDTLLALCPGEPLVDLPDCTLEWMTARAHGKWWKRAAELRLQYPGFQAVYWKLEHMKFGHCFVGCPLPHRPLPAPGSPLVEFVRARISHAKALWSRDISAGWTELQFREWLRLHVNGETWMPPLQPDAPGWSEALQVLRVAYGFARLDPTITWERCDPPRRGKRGRQ
jgi:hypothetical protein